jgi:segregation and condensation protein A
LPDALLLPHLPKVYGEVMTEMPRDLYIPPDALEIILESFEGPLDLLLYLIRRANINVLDIPMAPLTVHSIWPMLKPCANTTSNWPLSIC